MIDLNKIEEAAKAATPGPWYSSSVFRDEGAPLFVCAPVYDTEDKPIVCHIKNDVSGLPLNDFDYSNAAHIATSSPATVLEMVSMIRERDAVLKQALEALQDNRDDVARVERSQYMRDYYDPAIAAIKEVLK